MTERHSPPAPPCATNRVCWPRRSLPWLSLIAALLMSDPAQRALARAPKAPTPAVAEPLAVRLLTEDPLMSNGDALSLLLAIDGLSGSDEPTLRMEINGHEAKSTVVFAPKAAPIGQPRRGEWSLRVAAPPVDYVVTASVSHRGRTAFSPPLRVLRYQPPPSAPRLFALVVGVSSYGDARLNLNYAAKDAQDFITALRSGIHEDKDIYSKAEFRLLQNGQATREAVQAGMDWLQSQVKAEDVAVMFVAGHGMQEPQSGRYHFLPYDADVSNLPGTALGQDEFTALRHRVAGKLILFLDSCHAGAVMHRASAVAARPAVAPLSQEFLRTLSTKGHGNGVVVFASATDAQSAVEAKAWGNGAFTKAVVEGLGGQGDFNRSGTVTISELELYVSERVRQLTHGRQSPVIWKEMMVDFPVATVKLAPAPERGVSGPLTGAPPLIFAGVVCALVVAMRRRPQQLYQVSLPMMIALRNSLELMRSRLSGDDLRGSSRDDESGEGGAGGASPGRGDGARRGRVNPKALLRSIDPLLLRSMRSDMNPQRRSDPGDSNPLQRVERSRSASHNVRHSVGHSLGPSVLLPSEESPKVLRSMSQRLRRAAQRAPLLRSMDVTLRGSSDLFGPREGR